MLRLERVLAVGLSVLLPIAAHAQAGGIDWSDVDCAQSRIWPTMGLRCRSTVELTTEGLSRGPTDHFRFWNAAGTVQDVKYYYYVAEAVSARAAIVAKQDLADALRARSPQARGSVEMSEVRQLPGVDFVSFRSAAKEPCVGIRKTGPVNAEGARWLLYATRCVPPGQQISEADIDGFVREARLRE